ncbi:unnamed protein product [Bemisia tabaci]|uniref:Tetratricopeptide repeat protein 1 n=1 Tax=Bemisia tabaci TaxID=7038 RepID=A0A9P0C791_BEMTA|nr:unnamed protein product [Bemisia tabaci]
MYNTVCSMTDNSPQSSLASSKAGIPSNEELIDDLTKDLEESCSVDKKPSDSSTNNFNKFSEDPNFEEKDFAISDDEDESEDAKEDAEKETEDPEDFIDEEALKQTESTYSEEEKEEAKKEANRLKDEGNAKFKNMEFKESALAYTAGLRTCPLCFTKDRAILYANRAAAKIQLDLKSAAIKDCSKSIELEPTYIKPYIRRAKLYEQTDKLDEALADHKKIIELDPRQRESYQAIPRLQDEINVRNEKLKTEMLGKLKDLGNMILRPFGLSTNNFQVQQDPNTGGYSVNFKQ